MVIFILDPLERKPFSFSWGVFFVLTGVHSNWILFIIGRDVEMVRNSRICWNVFVILVYLTVVMDSFIGVTDISSCIHVYFVTDAPQVSLTVTPGSDVHEFDYVTFTCSAHSRPPVDTWR